ncbi:amino-acid N-acetyltransferase [Methylophilaceae bacterium]|nr:amino-acid N-acetyltransferase [Methylophilaceae bacterium]
MLVHSHTRGLNNMTYRIFTNKEISALEYSSLMQSVGWGSDYSEELVHRSIAAYPFVAHARSVTGDLWGYVSAFSDQAFCTMLGELVVHPAAQRRGIGQALMSAVEKEFSGVPIYVKPLGDAKYFFEACGYRAPATEIQVLFKLNGA